MLYLFHISTLHNGADGVVIISSGVDRYQPEIRIRMEVSRLPDFRIMLSGQD